jgi:ABC-type glycerol-3-phosphate transport system substrate-binding protein
MTKLAKLALAAALTVGICSGGAMAQSVGPTDPAKADTTDPNSTPKAKTMKKVKKAAHAKKHHKTM